MALVQQNLVPGTGDHLITLDTDTNLEWLSLNATANLSYLDVLGGAGGYTTTYGFRYATGQEISLLHQHAGITKFGLTQTVPFPQSNHVAMETLIELMGGAALYPSLSSGSVLVQTQGMMKFRGAGVPTPMTPSIILRVPMRTAIRLDLPAAEFLKSRPTWYAIASCPLVSSLVERRPRLAKHVELGRSPDFPSPFPSHEASYRPHGTPVTTADSTSPFPTGLPRD
ncbi:MAG: hypothetical protein DYH03_11275 [Nitrospira sp. NTP1]|nr:hypothetical protein [Nitrospira sp. NTP1]